MSTSIAAQRKWPIWAWFCIVFAYVFVCWAAAAVIDRCWPGVYPIEQWGISLFLGTLLLYVGFVARFEVPPEARDKDWRGVRKLLPIALVCTGALLVFGLWRTIEASFVIAWLLDISRWAIKKLRPA